MTPHTRPIGIFDSGIGGLTVLSSIQRYLPNEDIVYLGDTANYPYGPRSAEQVRKLAIRGARYLMDREIKLLIVACNTASAVALEEITAGISVPVLGVVAPGAAAGLAASKKRVIGIIGTEGTIRSQAYIKAIQAIDPNVTLHTQACPLFVPLAEEGWTSGLVPREVAKTYLGRLIPKEVDVLILGCTHYPLLKAVIAEVMGPSVTLVDSAEATAQSAAELLNRLNLANPREEPGFAQFFVTDAPEKFAALGTYFLGTPLTAVEKIVLT